MVLDKNEPSSNKTSILPRIALGYTSKVKEKYFFDSQGFSGNKNRSELFGHNSLGGALQHLIHEKQLWLPPERNDLYTSRTPSCLRATVNKED